MTLGWVFLLCAPFALACVNNGDDTSGKPQGSLGGVCFANNTCNSGLDCVLENGSGICELADATLADSPVTETGSDTSPPSDGSSDGGLGDGSDGACNAQGIYPCNGLDCSPPDSGGSCCNKLSKCTTQTGCAQPLWACTTRTSCGGGYCCAVLTYDDKNACPPTAHLQSDTDTMCSANPCGSGFVSTCKPGGNDCPSIAPNCVAVAVDTIPMGFCMP